MMEVNGGGVEVDGDLDNRACITDRQEDRKERKDLRTLKKIYGEQLKKKSFDVYFFYLPSTMFYVLFTLNNVPQPIDDELPKIRLKRITRRISI